MTNPPNKGYPMNNNDDDDDDPPPRQSAASEKKGGFHENDDYPQKKGGIPPDQIMIPSEDEMLFPLEESIFASQNAGMEMIGEDFDTPPPYIVVGPPPAYAQEQKKEDMPLHPSTQPTVTVFKFLQFGPYPMQTKCPHCDVEVLTRIVFVPGLLTYLFSITCILVGCFCGCCMIPCYMTSTQDIIHVCPSCKADLGCFKRL